MSTYRVGLTGDLHQEGMPSYDFSGLEEAADVELCVVRGHGELTAADVAGLDALVLFSPTVTARTVADGHPFLVARLGVGTDNVDVPACTAAGTIVTITPDGVRRPMATGAMAFVLALAHRLPELDAHVRAGGWERFRHIGTGLDGRTLGIVGLGNVGRELVPLAQAFGLRVLAADPFAREVPEGVELLELDRLLAVSDFVVLACPLTPETHHLIDARRLALMQPTARLVNIARGPVVDGAALAEALRERRIAGAALDVFEQEPIDPADPLLALDTVLLAPHAVGMTDEILRLGGRSVTRSVLAVLRGDVPEHVLDRSVLEREDVRARLASYRG